MGTAEMQNYGYMVNSPSTDILLRFDLKFELTVLPRVVAVIVHPAVILKSSRP